MRLSPKVQNAINNLILLMVICATFSLGISTMIPGCAFAQGQPVIKIRVDEAVPNFNLPAFNKANVKNLIGRIATMKQQIESTLSLEGKSPEKIALSSEVIACDLIAEWLQKISAGFDQPSIDMMQLEKSYLLVMRIWYSLDAFIQIWPKATTAQIVAFCLRTAAILAAAPLAVKIPAADPDSLIGLPNAQLEAPFLYNSGKKRLSAEEMAKMTHREVSKLEPLEESNVYRANNTYSPEIYKAFEKEIEDMVKACPQGNPDFSLEEAKKCFTFDHFLTSGSHPKISVEDKFGFKWKVKFGEEMHTELFITRLYIILGGRYADLKYHIPAGSVPLVLEPPSEQQSNKNAISYFYQMQEIYEQKKSPDVPMQFRVSDWLLPQNIIKDEQGRILGNGIVDEEFRKKYKIKKKYLGSYYLYFKESTMSFAPPIAKKLGAAAFSGLGATMSRAARSSIIFNLFLLGLDAKDENCQLVLLYNPQTGRYDKPIEYQSDLGCILGSPTTAGEINSVDWEWLVPLPGFLGFNVKTMYYPGAWKKASFADAMWMARKIASLDLKTFEWTISEGKWEPFVQSLILEKLKSRRNQMIKIFGLDKEGFAMMPVNKNLTITAPGTDSQLDTPVLNGMIVSPANSSIVREAEKNHPEGIFKVKNPFID